LGNLDKKETVGESSPFIFFIYLFLHLFDYLFIFKFFLFYFILVKTVEEIEQKVCSGDLQEIPPPPSSNEAQVHKVLSDLAVRCWSQSPYDRPGFIQIYELLEPLRGH